MNTQPATLHSAVHRLQDTAFLGAYTLALRQNAALLRGKSVLVLGDGCGFLSVVCAQAGAATVYALEASELCDLVPKLAACNKLKLLIETGRMKIRSASLVSELKTFVASGMGYAAKPGETDDLVMSTVLAIRMLQLLQSYDTDINNQLRDHGDEVKPPMPFIAVLR